MRERNKTEPWIYLRSLEDADKWLKRSEKTIELSHSVCVSRSFKKSRKERGDKFELK